MVMYIPLEASFDIIIHKYSYINTGLKFYLIFFVFDVILSLNRSFTNNGR